MPRFRLLAIIALFLVNAAAAGWAASGPPAPDRLEERLGRQPRLADLITYALRNNPAIAAARHHWRAAIEGVRVAGALPDPQLMATWFTDPIETRLGPQDWNATLSQQLPGFGKLARKQQIAVVDAQLARLQLEITIRDTAVAVRQSAWELSYIETALAVADKNQQLLTHFQQTAAVDYNDDQATLTDLVKAQAQAGQAGYDLILLNELQATEQARLNGLLNRPPDATLDAIHLTMPTLPAYSLTELYDLAVKNRLEILLAGQRRRKQALAQQLARLQRLPDFKLGIFYAAIGQPEVINPPDNAGHDAVGIQAGLSLPLWPGKNRGRIAAATARLQQAKETEQEIKNSTRTMVRQLFFKLQNSGRLITLYRDNLLPQAQATLTLAQTWQQQGQGSFSDFLEAQAAAYNFQLALARAQADYGKLLAQLEQLTSVPLTTHDHGEVQP